MKLGRTTFNIEKLRGIDLEVAISNLHNVPEKFVKKAWEKVNPKTQVKKTRKTK